MKISEIGEFGLINRLAKDCLNRPEAVVMGIGDDTAVVQPPDGMLSLITTDMLVEGVHFSLATASPWDIGYKALAVNVSDIAAMGGIPTHAVVAIGIPKTQSVEFIEEIYYGIKACAREFQVNLVGGDTVSSPLGLVINVTLMGEVEPDRVCFRSGARAGDLVAVSGHLGGSAAGLAVLTGSVKTDDRAKEEVCSKHLRPAPRVEVARALTATGEVTSLNDISDGLASEINEITAASKVGSIISGDKLPVAESTKRVARGAGVDPVDWALYGGEDFELVFTIKRDRAVETLTAVATQTGVALTIIGEITSAAQGVILDYQGRLQPLMPRGYNHFVEITQNE